MKLVQQAGGYGDGVTGSQALDVDLKAHPLLTQPNGAGVRGITSYWQAKLQPFFDDFGFDLGSVRVQYAVLGDGEVGMTNYHADPRMINLDVHIYGMKQWELSTILHESMHLVQGDIYGAWYGDYRSVADTFRFGASTDSQYNVRSYPELGFLSYSDISIAGGGSYPVEAGFNRFSDNVIQDNLYRCGGICR